MVYTSQYLEISTFEMKTVVYWKNQSINTFKANESNVIRIIGITIIIAIIMKTVVFIWSNLTCYSLKTQQTELCISRYCFEEITICMKFWAILSHL